MSRNSGLDTPPCVERKRLKQLDTSRTVDNRHGRIEIRRIQVSDRLKGHLDWPGFAQAIRIERTRTIKGKQSHEVSYAITSVGRDRADAKDLLAIMRGHWGIENRLHWVRDVAWSEDKCRARSGSLPQNLAAMRNAALTLLRVKGHKAITSTLRLFAARHQKVISILNL